MTARTGLELENITITKADKRAFDDEEFEQLVDGIVDLTEDFGWEIIGTLIPSQGWESMKVDSTLNKPDKSDFTDEEVQRFLQKLSELAGQLGLLVQGKHKLVDISYPKLVDISE